MVYNYVFFLFPNFVILSIKETLSCGLSVTQKVKFFVTEPSHRGSTSRLGTCAHIFLDLFRTLW